MINILDKIDVWHTGCSDLPLHEYLEMTREEYANWVMTCQIPASKKDIYYEGD